MFPWSIRERALLAIGAKRCMHTEASHEGWLCCNVGCKSHLVLVWFVCPRARCCSRLSLGSPRQLNQVCSPNWLVWGDKTDKTNNTRTSCFTRRREWHQMFTAEPQNCQLEDPGFATTASLYGFWWTVTPVCSDESVFRSHWQRHRSYYPKWTKLSNTRLSEFSANWTSGVLWLDINNARNL
jgi:hypothetical protein